jgi:hypothetical protein
VPFSQGSAMLTSSTQVWYPYFLLGAATFHFPPCLPHPHRSTLGTREADEDMVWINIVLGEMGKLTDIHVGSSVASFFSRIVGRFLSVKTAIAPKKIIFSSTFGFNMCSLVQCCCLIAAVKVANHSNLQHDEF